MVGERFLSRSGATESHDPGAHEARSLTGFDGPEEWPTKYSVVPVMYDSQQNEHERVEPRAGMNASVLPI